MIYGAYHVHAPFPSTYPLCDGNGKDRRNHENKSDDEFVTHPICLRTTSARRPVGLGRPSVIPISSARARGVLSPDAPRPIHDPHSDNRVFKASIRIGAATSGSTYAVVA